MVENNPKTPSFNSALAEKAEMVNATLDELFTEQNEIQDELKTAMTYTLDAPGKRIRAAVVLWCCELIAGKTNESAKMAAAAIEMVHTYSLVHDDLPAMDDDDLRRGRPSCHKAFGEATAILTGDALLTLAFELLASKIKDQALSVRLIKILANAAGPAGMIGGQMADIKAEQSVGNIELLRYIHTNKTAKMFAGAAMMGAIAGGGDDNQIQHLGRYGLDVGLGFQVADDMLDISATSRQLGKTAGKDLEQGKVTYPGVVGVTESRCIAEKFAENAISALDIFDERAWILRKLAEVLLERTK